VFDAKIAVVFANALFVAEITDETVDVTNISRLQIVTRIDLSFKQLHALWGLIMRVTFGLLLVLFRFSWKRCRLQKIAHMSQSFALFKAAEFLLPWHSPRLRALFHLRTTGVHSFIERVRPFCSLFPNKNNTSVRRVSYCKRTNSAVRPYLTRPNPFLWKELTVVVV
jgi:hypothetical protein